MMSNVVVSMATSLSCRNSKSTRTFPARSLREPQKLDPRKLGPARRATARGLCLKARSDNRLIAFAGPHPCPAHPPIATA